MENSDMGLAVFNLKPANIGHINTLSETES
jgi:hypothetical protein